MNGPTVEAVFRDYAPRVFDLARRMLGDGAGAEEVAAEVLLRAVRELEALRAERSPADWLDRVTESAARRRRAASCGASSRPPW